MKMNPVLPYQSDGDTKVTSRLVTDHQSALVGADRRSETLSH
jgi:hypothetical protein